MNASNSLFPSVYVRRLLWLGLFALTIGVTAQVPDDLKGSWVMDDGDPALFYPANQTEFAIVGASPSKSTWADGHFFLRWVKAARPERGYYSLETGRIWLTTYRWVNRKEERVEYSGTIERDENARLIWTGTAKTTGHRKVTWHFVATKN